MSVTPEKSDSAREGQIDRLKFSILIDQQKGIDPMREEVFNG